MNAILTEMPVVMKSSTWSRFWHASIQLKEETMKILKTVFLVFLILFIGSAPIYAEQCFSRLIVFGDSNVDSGVESEYSLYNLTGGLIPGPPNVGGRSCNGPVVVEYAAEILGVSLENYGVGGATTGIINLVGLFIPSLPEMAKNSGVLSQLQWFENSHVKKKANRRALFVLWAGSNDLFGATEADLSPRINNALENIETTLVNLTNLGARNILVATRTVRPEYYEPNNVNGVIFNARLRVHVQQLNQELKSNIQIFEAFDLISDMTYNPSNYGFEETTARCALEADCIADPAISDTYITWDDAHKTTKVHEIMAEALVSQAFNMRGCDDSDDDDDDDDDDDEIDRVLCRTDIEIETIQCCSTEFVDQSA